jgi:hypothetical protein
MLTHLPQDIQHIVYDKLPACDRVKMNASLPKDQKITNTTSTNMAMSKRLGVLSKALKRRPHMKNHGNIVNFLKEHKSDPTVAELDKSSQVPTKDVLLQALLENKLHHFPKMDLAETQEIGRDNGLVTSLLEDIANNWDGPRFQAVMGHVGARQLMDVIFEIPFNVRSLVFKSVNMANESLFQYFASTPMFSPGLEYVKSPHTASIFVLPDCIRLLLKHGDLSAESYDAMMDAAISRMNVDGLEVLMEARK